MAKIKLFFYAERKTANITQLKYNVETPKNNPPSTNCIPCKLCKRTCALTFHHLIPRKLHRRTHFKKHYSKEQLNQGVMICRKCHSGIHKLYDEITLGKQLNTLEALQKDAAITKHCNWVAKQRTQKE